eukprot:805193-Rhodomonas_salina.1
MLLRLSYAVCGTDLGQAAAFKVPTRYRARELATAILSLCQRPVSLAFGPTRTELDSENLNGWGLGSSRSTVRRRSRLP